MKSISQRSKTNMLIIILSAVIMMANVCLGMVIPPVMNGMTALLVTIGLTAALYLGVLISVLTSTVYVKRLNTMPVEARLEMIKSRQTSTRDSLAWAQKRVSRAGTTLILTIILHGLLTLGTAFFAGQLMANPSAVNSDPLLYISVAAVYFPMTSMLSALWTLRNKFDFSEYTAPEDYPLLHATARRAAEAMGCKGDIRILLTNDANAGILQVKNTYSLQLGVYLLSVLTEEELYQILLHEFAHVNDGNITKFKKRNDALVTLSNRPDIGFPFSLFIRFAAARFTFEHTLFMMLATEQMETHADAAVLTQGDPTAMVSALAKTNMNEFFSMEFLDFISEPFWKNETPRENAATLQSEAFRTALQTRGEFWLELLSKELDPQFRTHPIFRQRCEQIGRSVASVHIELPDMNTPYGHEVTAALTHMDKKIFDIASDGYEEHRKRLYLDPLDVVRTYEQRPSTYTTAELSPVINAYRDLNRYEEALAICEGILEHEENPFATAHALYFKGCHLLSKYDAAGIDMIYQAIDLNSNYIEDGLEAIGAFCCRMGLESEREEYRCRFVELTQAREDKYDQACSLRPGDRLIEEHLPEGRSERNIAFMVKAGDGHIQSIYLVRKMITNDFFASAYVIKFAEGTDDEQIGRSMDAIFHYLDSAPEDWHYALFLYDKETEKAVHKVRNACVFNRET